MGHLLVCLRLIGSHSNIIYYFNSFTEREYEKQKQKKRKIGKKQLEEDQNESGRNCVKYQRLL